MTKKIIKDWAPQHYVGRIRSKMNLEVILEVKNVKSKKNPINFWPFLAKLLVTTHKGLKFGT